MRISIRFFKNYMGGILNLPFYKNHEYISKCVTGTQKLKGGVFQKFLVIVCVEHHVYDFCVRSHIWGDGGRWGRQIPVRKRGECHN